MSPPRRNRGCCFECVFFFQDTGRLIRVNQPGLTRIVLLPFFLSLLHYTSPHSFSLLSSHFGHFPPKRSVSLPTPHDVRGRPRRRVGGSVRCFGSGRRHPGQRIRRERRCGARLAKRYLQTRRCRRQQRSAALRAGARRRRASAVCAPRVALITPARGPARC